MAIFLSSPYTPSVSRTAVDVLEFDKLRAILRRFSTSPPGRRHIDSLAPSNDRFSLDADFALIREAIDFHIEGLQQDGLPVPPPTTICEYVETQAA